MDNLLKLSIDDLTLVQWPMENLSDGARRPPSWALPCCRHALCVQALRDSPNPQAARVHVVDLADHRRLSLIHDPEDMQPMPVGRLDLLIVVPVHLPAGDMACLGLAQHRVIGPFRGIFALHFTGEVGQGEHHLVCR